MTKLLQDAARYDRRNTDKEDRVDPMWAADEDDRRMAIARRVAAGARRTLAGK